MLSQPLFAVILLIRSNIVNDIIIVTAVHFQTIIFGNRSLTACQLWKWSLNLQIYSINSSSSTESEEILTRSLMYVCMYVCMYMCMYMYIYTYVCMYAYYMYVRIYYIYIYIYIYVRMYTMYIHSYVYVHVCIYLCIVH